MIIKKIIKKKYLWVEILPFFMMIILISLSSIPKRHLPVFDFQNFDKFEHFMAYCTISFSWFLSLKSQGVSFVKSLIMSVIFSFIYGVFEENYQGKFIDGRVYDNFDLVADFLGASFSSLFIFIRYKSIYYFKNLK